ncbi:hypothetical protein B0T22DRAFT_481165 [Podospora appendiculata]|uniref:Uncharacterized protein n=1 Tax=Podospora appendiculata TaxID=314037 RepID=A0AAE0XCD0_9PEZI|nr:hypothetical protein B0T22DRAFT_481165 [Podospora appendiculata]
MAWGSANKTQAPPSAIRQILPLLITFAIIGGLAFLGYQIYLSVVKIQAQASKKLSSKNVTFTKDGGVRVAVKDVRNEDYVDSTQRAFVKAWNLSGGSKEEGAQQKKKKYVV